MSKSPTVLIIDDDSDICLGTSLRLKMKGYDPILASDGEQAVASAVANHPAAIVMDVRMPRMDGVTALIRLKQNDLTKRIPVIMLSASVTDRQGSLDAGARFFIDKPYQGKTLVAAVDTAIAESNQPADCRSERVSPPTETSRQALVALECDKPVRQENTTP